MSSVKAQCIGVSESDSLELVNFFEAMNGDNWRFNTGWLESPVKDWFGVEVVFDGEDGTCYVSKIDLANNLLDGTIPELNLPFLSDLDLKRNNLLSTLPSFSQCPELQFLNISYNQLIGELPDFNLPKLQYLDFQTNQLTGSIPNFANLPQLEFINLFFNQLSGEIPNFTHLQNLKELSFISNQLTGAIPDFNHLPNLESLELGGNQLTGTIPDFAHLQSLKTLSLINNEVTGSIVNFNHLPNLEHLGLGGNQLTGSIPNFSHLPKLKTLHLSGNQLTGNIPNFSHLPNLTSLRIVRTQLDTEIPNFDKLPNLEFLDLSDNLFDGNIPNFSNFLHLESLNLSKNPWTGSIPNFNLPQLEYLLIDSTSLSGTIPDFSNMANIKFLFIPRNQLIGTVPDFSNIPQLEEAYLSDNQLTGGLPDFSNLPSLNLLFLDNNQLSGELVDFSNLSNLTWLTLNENQLTGELIDFSNLPNLSSLSLNNNQLVGAIPNFAQLPNLNVLELNNNQLTGIIPDFTLLSELIVANFSDNQLTGNLPNFSNLPNLTKLYIGGNQLNGYLPNFTNLPVLEVVTACSNNFLGNIPNFDNCPLFDFEASDLDCIESAIVTGTIFYDDNNNCLQDIGEATVSNAKISINGNSYCTFSDENGFYKLQLDTGTYQIEITPPNSLWEQSCPVNPDYYTLTLENYTDSIPNQNFGLEIEDECTLLTIDIATPLIRRCFSNKYTVYYCNEGTKSADNAHVELTFPPDILPSGASIPFVQNGNLWTFDLDTLSIGECSSFTVDYSVDCDAVLGSTACVEARIYPAFLCREVDSLWDGSSLVVEGECIENESIQFTITNTGEDMQDSIEYRIYEDDILSSLDKVKLMHNVSEQLTISATGATYRLKAEQSEFHPFESIPQAVVELCGEEPYSLGFVTSQPNSDLEHFVDIDCQEIIGSYDPNDKTVHPTGITDQNYIEEGTELTYKIRFQNTGNDTAFTVTIVDTIQSEYLDLETFQITTASHPYEAYVTNQNVLVVTFNNILLPDSTTNEPESHGFVQYKITSFEDAPKNAVVTNTGDIYFDYNEPITTNTVFNTIGIPTLVPNSVFELLQFNAYWSDSQTAEISWMSLSEIDNIYYSVQRSIDGVSFEAIGGIGGKGSQTNPNSYYFEDKDLPSDIGTYFYRLQQTDFNGQSSFSKVIALTLQNEQSARVWYDAAHNCLEIIANHSLQLQIFDALGRLVRTFEVREGRQTFDLQGLGSGVYVYQLEMREMGKFLVLRK